MNIIEPQAGTDPWDPDTDDDDGLTDGQEAKWVTTVDKYNVDSTIRKDHSTSYDTEPLDPDTDGDGYWDGWIGVYGVGNSENVILYRDRLETQGSVTRNEAVPEQAGVHDAVEAPTATTAEIDGEKVHSNVHVGELQWGSDPTDNDDTPSLELTIEVDFYEGANTDDIDTQEWERGIEQNYALYDIEVDIIRDDTLTDENLTDEFRLTMLPDGGFGGVEVIATRLLEGDVGADEYVIVAHKAGGPFLGDYQTGVNVPIDPAQALFTDPMENTNIPNDVVQRSPYDSSVAMYAAKTQIHEIGHSLRTGEADDRSFTKDPVLTFERLGEIYSGSTVDGKEDRTIERVNGSQRWSIMSSGWNENLEEPPMKGRYFTYSIEELSTVEEP